MAHHNTIKGNSYNRLVGRLNIFPQGAPPAELLYQILKVLFSEKEAVLGVILRLPPAKQILASDQFKSRYLSALIKHASK